MSDVRKSPTSENGPTGEQPDRACWEKKAREMAHAPTPSPAVPQTRWRLEDDLWTGDRARELASLLCGDIGPQPVAPTGRDAAERETPPPAAGEEP